MKWGAPSFAMLLSALTSFPWVIAQMLILSFCGWCFYIYNTKEKGSATDIAVFIFVASIICSIQQVLHVILMALVCGGRRCGRSMKILDSAGSRSDDEEDDVENGSEQQPLLDNKRGDSDKAQPSPIKVIVVAVLILSAVLLCIFIAWMFYGCVLVFKQPIQSYRGCVTRFCALILRCCDSL